MSDSSKLIPFESVQLTKYIKEVKQIYEGDGIRSALRRLSLLCHGEESLALAESDKPYLELFYVEGYDRFCAQVYLLGFRIDEWNFRIPKDFDFSKVLLPNLDQFLTIPWGKIRSGSRNRSMNPNPPEFTFYGLIDVNSKYWRKTQAKVLAEWEDRKAEKAKTQRLEDIESEISKLNGTQEERICNLTIEAGIHNGQQGYFGYYRREATLFCTRFCREIYKSELVQYLDNEVDHKFRTPWKKIREGFTFSADVILAEYFAARAGSRSMADWIYLEPEFKKKCEYAAELEKQYWYVRKS